MINNEAICVILYELQADIDYIFGRVVADASCVPVMATSVKSKLGALEIALKSAHYDGKKTSDDYPTEYIARLRTYVEEDGQLSHRNGVTLLDEVERLQGLVPRYLGGTRA
jgi:hypothetical protein